MAHRLDEIARHAVNSSNPRRPLSQRPMISCTSPPEQKFPRAAENDGRTESTPPDREQVAQLRVRIESERFFRSGRFSVMTPRALPAPKKCFDRGANSLMCDMPLELASSSTS